MFSGCGHGRSLMLHQRERGQEGQIRGVKGNTKGRSRRSGNGSAVWRKIPTQGDKRVLKEQISWGIWLLLFLGGYLGGEKLCRRVQPYEAEITNFQHRELEGPKGSSPPLSHVLALPYRSYQTSFMFPFAPIAFSNPPQVSTFVLIHILVSQSLLLNLSPVVSKKHEFR